MRNYAPASSSFEDLASRRKTLLCLFAQLETVFAPSLSGGRQTRPNLDLDTADGYSPGFELGMKIFAAGFRDFFVPFFKTVALFFSGVTDGGAGSANPKSASGDRP